MKMISDYYLGTAVFILTLCDPVITGLAAYGSTGSKWQETVTLKFDRQFNRRVNRPAQKLLPSTHRVESEPQHPFQDFSGKELIIVANHIPGFFSINPDKPPSGVEVEMVKALSKALNFTYRVVQPADGQWGNPLPNGTVTGNIGMVARWEADFGICVIAVTGLRETVVDFTFPYFYEPLAIFTRAPQEKNRALAILSPFTSMAWIAIAVSLSLIGVILKLESMAAKHLLKYTYDWSLLTYSFNMFRNLVIQGNLLISHHWSQRFIFFSWYLFCLIIATLYTGMLLTALAIPAYEKTVDSLSDLPRAVKEGFALTILEGSSSAALFEDAKDGIYRETWELFNHDNPSESFVHRRVPAVQKVSEGKFIYIDFKVATEILVNQLGKHKFHVARDTFYPQLIAITCPPGAPYKDILSKSLMRMTQGGLISKLLKDEMDKFSGKSFGTSSGLQSSAITLTHLQAAFFLITLGCSTATVSFIFEKFIAVKFRRINFLQTI